MSSPTHRHNPYVQAIPDGYASVSLTAPSQQQHAYQPEGVEIHTQVRKTHSGNTSRRDSSANLQSNNSNNYPNVVHGVQHGYHSAPQASSNSSTNIYQQQNHHYDPSYYTYGNQQYGGGSHNSSSWQLPFCGDADCRDPACGVPMAACFPAGVMDSLVDAGKNLADGEDEEEEDCRTSTFGNCMAPPASSLGGGDQQSLAGVAPPLYSQFLGVGKGATPNASSNGLSPEDSITSAGAPSDLNGETPMMFGNGAAVVKTNEKVIRAELNGRVPYLHFPPREEMETLVQEAKEAQAVADQETLLRNPTMVGPDGKLKKSYFPVFFGQVIFSATQTHMNWLILHLTGLLPAAVSSNSPGCFNCYFTSMQECNTVLGLNKRLLFDTEGVWVAQNPQQTDQIFNSATHWKLKQQREQSANGKSGSNPRLPRGALVVELPMSGGNSRNHRGGGGSGNHNGPAVRVNRGPANRMM